MTISAFKTAFNTFHESQQHLTHQKMVTPENIRQLLTERSAFFDHWLDHFWQQHVSNTSQAALIAVGGYGAGILHPHSDLDVIILLTHDDGAETMISQNHQDKITDFVTQLWDLKVVIGHSVRTFKQLLEAMSDLTVATSLLNIRFIAGNQSIYQQLLQFIDDHLLGKSAHIQPIWSKPYFFNAKVEEQIARHENHQDALYNLEPNLKNSPGGLRDIQTIFWLAHHYSGHSDEDWLIEQNILTHTELNGLHECQAFLWILRFQLHCYYAHPEERLSFEAQKQLSIWQGATHIDQAAIEDLMQNYYRTVAQVTRISDMMFTQLAQRLLHAQPQEPVVIDDYFQSYHHYLAIRPEHIFAAHPESMFTLFQHLHHQTHIQQLDAETLRQVSLFAQQLSSEQRNHPALKKAFIALWKMEHGLTHILRYLHHNHILAHYLPAFKDISGRMQFDLFHVYTVDQHAIMSVRHVRRMALSRFAHENPHAASIMQQVNGRHRLYLAAFFHDIGKGRGGDHSAIGAEITRQFCLSHYLSLADSLTICWLVEHHLLMSTVAQKKDIDDPHVLEHFAHCVQNSERLDLLYLLTIADISATNPKLWNTWRSRLLRTLYERTKTRLTHTPASSKAENHIILTLLQKAPIQKEKHSSLLKMLPQDMSSRYDKFTLLLILRMIIKKKADDRVWINLKSHQGIIKCTIYQRKCSTDFSISTSALSYLDFSIVEAKFEYFPHDYSIEHYSLLPKYSFEMATIQPQLHLRNVRKYLQHCLLQKINIHKHHYRLATERQFDCPTQILFGSDTIKGHSVLELIASDCLGLLACVMDVFKHQGIILHHAKINTFNMRVEDIFFITNHQENALNQEEKRQLKSTLMLNLQQFYCDVS